MKSEDKSGYLHWLSSRENTWIFIAKFIAGDQGDSNLFKDPFRHPENVSLHSLSYEHLKQGWIALPKATASTLQNIVTSAVVQSCAF